MITFFSKGDYDINNYNCSYTTELSYIVVEFHIDRPLLLVEHSACKFQIY